MRRTYVSKKDTGGALDHREMLQNMDEKCSAFDAFYIQNLKQAKRELSCVRSSNPNGAASNKVRKRKYVKRIVKEEEKLPQRDTMSSSAYLTPDKSLRVNRFLDPFDMLLNSSSNGQVKFQENRKDSFDIIPPKKEGKTYTRKKSRKIKKYNYSSDYSTDSDKENASKPSSNVTDIRTHELLVERAPSNSPKNVDDSINKIVNNLSLVNKGKSKAFNVSYKHRNRLTKNCHSPILQKSPLCSTPCKEKYRGKSIYNFSPISINKESPNYGMIAEENNDCNNSIVFICKQNVPKLSKERYPTDVPMEESMDKASKSLVYEDVVINDNENVEQEIKLRNDQNETEQSILQITVFEPFLGFSGDRNTDSINIKKDYLLKCIKEHNLNTEPNDIEDTTEDRLINEEKSITSKEFTFSSNNMSINSQYSDKESMYDTCNSEQSDTETEKIIQEPVVALERIRYSLMKLYKNSDSDSDTNTRKHNVTAEKINDSLEYHENSDTDRKTRKNEVTVERLSDLVYHENNYSDKDINITREPIVTSKRINDSLIKKYHGNSYSDANSSNNTEPVVSVQRMSDSMFMKYYEKMHEQEFAWHDSLSDDFQRDDSENCFEDTKIDIEGLLSENTRDGESNDGNSFSNYSENSVNSKNTDSEMQPIEIIIMDSLTTEDFPSTNDESIEEEKYVSFVTTRRRNERNDSVFIFDNSYGSSSTDCDKTVLSYKPKTDLEVDISVGKTEMTVNEIDCEDKHIQDFDKDSSRITTRKSSRLPTPSSTDRYSEVKITNDIDNNENLSKKFETYPKYSRSSVTTRKSSRIPRPSHTKLNSSEETLNETKGVDDNAAPIEELYQKEIENIPANSRSCGLSRKSCEMFRNSILSVSSVKDEEVKPGIVLKPGKKWERSLSIYRRMTTMADHFDQSIIDDEPQMKGRKYRQSIITTMELQDSLHNESINSRRSTFISKPSRSTIRLIKESSSSRQSLNSTEVFDDLKGFLSEECDDTVIELSKLSLAESEFEVTVLDAHETSERIATARDYVLSRCNQTDLVPFDECYPETVLKNCHKIGEGVYGEVFLWRGRDGRARVMKIVPIAGTVKVNGETQKDFHEVISEIVIAMELSALRAPIADIDRNFDEGKDIAALDLHSVENATDVFNEVLAVRCVQGPYPSRLLDLWELYDECKGSENDNPASLPGDQQYIVLELANAGQDLESYQFTGAQQAHALFQQIAFGLAVGEESFQFEHRDLHWGNVLIASTEQKHATFVLRGRTYRVPRGGVAATIIDYSLSRISLPLLGERASLYNDLATDEQLFEAQGDYQFQVYRLMRHKLGNDWKNFEPYTNILWLHYTVDKMITALRYKRTNTKIHKHYIEKLKGIKDTILAFKSAADYVLTAIEI